MTSKITNKAANPSNLALVPAQPSNSTPFTRMIDEWLVYCRACGRSQKTRDTYRSFVEKFYWWWSEYTHYAEKLGDHPKYVTRKEAREFVAYLREPNAFRWGIPPRVNNGYRQELSAASIASYGKTVRVFFNWLVHEDYIDTHPFTRVEFGTKKSDRAVKTLDPNGIAKIFSWLGNPDRLKTWSGKRDLAMFSLFYDTGIRKGELLSMRFDDVQLDRRRITVRGKTGERQAPLSEDSRAVLYNYMQHPNTLRSGALWQTVDGLPLTPSGLYSIVRRVQAGCEVKFFPHRLRHTYATLMAAKGITLFDLMDLMGHKDAATTRVYVQRNMERLSELHRIHSPLTELAREVTINKRGRPKRETK